jgi:hypothetical protein
MTAGLVCHGITMMWQLVGFDSWIFLHDSWARNQVGIVFSYRPARLHRLAESIPWNRFLGSIEVLKYRLCQSFSLNNFTTEVEVLKTEQPLPHDAGFGVQNLPLYCTQYTFIIYCLAQPTAIKQKHV